MYSWELDDDDEEENVKDSYAGVQLVIFLIEATKGMMTKLPGEEEDMTGVQKSLSCVTAMMKNNLTHKTATPRTTACKGCPQCKTTSKESCTQFKAKST